MHLRKVLILLILMAAELTVLCMQIISLFFLVQMQVFKKHILFYYIFVLQNVMGSIYQRKRLYTMHIWPAIKRYNFYISIKILLECVNSYKYSVLNLHLVDFLRQKWSIIQKITKSLLKLQIYLSLALQHVKKKVYIYEYLPQHIYIIFF